MLVGLKVSMIFYKIKKIKIRLIVYCPIVHRVTVKVVKRCSTETQSQNLEQVILGSKKPLSQEETLIRTLLLKVRKIKFSW